MTAKEKLFELLDADLFGFICQMIEFKVSVGGDHKTLALDQGKWYVISTDPDKIDVPYHFTINDIWFQEYAHILDQSFQRFKGYLEKVQLWTGKDKDLKIDLQHYKTLLENARSEIASINLTKYSKQRKRIIKDIVWDGYGNAQHITVSFPPEARGAEELRQRHLAIMDDTIGMLTPSSKKPIQGVTILEKYRGQDNIKIRELFRALVNKLKLNPSQEDIFVRALTGKELNHPIFWPKKKQADLKRFFQGLVFTSCLHEFTQSDNVPWERFGAFYADENGQSYPVSIRGHSDKGFLDDAWMKGLFKSLMS